MRSQYSKIKKMQNQTGTGAIDEGAKFIWFDQIDEILNLTAKANGVPGAMDQGVPVPGTGTSNAPVDVSEEHGDGDQVPAATTGVGEVPAVSIGVGQRQ